MLEADQVGTGAPSAEATASGRPRRWLIPLFATTSFVGAALLFVVQPLVARLILPRYGGSATVWSTSNLFFQTALLVGYLYAHAATRRLGPRLQPALHLGVLLLPLVALPIVVPAGAAPGADTSPALWLLRTLTLMVGLPFAVISTTGPLLQRWYSWTGDRRSDDPYFLYATSNLGSFGGLLAYPFLVEPFLSLDQQRLWWSWGFGLFLVLMAACGVVTLRSRAHTLASAVASRPGRLPARRVATWLALAFLPSSLMLGVTAHISTDVAAIPLMWVVPLAIYLATFVVAFARTTRGAHARVRSWAAAVAGLAAVAYFLSASLPAAALIAVDLTLLAVVAYAAHSTLAALRPEPSQLTAFYLVVTLGGALGGVLNGLVAPALFTWVWEYPAIVAASALLAVGSGARPWGLLARRYHPAFVIFLETSLAALLLFAAVAGMSALRNTPWMALALLGVLGLSVLLARRPLSLALAVALVLVTLTVAGPAHLYRDRTFYGSYTVTEAAGVRTFSHGTTVHGTQHVGDQSREPTTYYARSGPVGDVYRELPRFPRVGLVGLGAGTLAAYGQEGQAFTFYELDPEVVRIARDPALFTYLADSDADVRTVVGDGRLRLAEAEPGSYDLLVLDAFSSDSIPVHLLTREAFELYRRVLAPDGVLLVHVSNRVFNLEPVVAAAGDNLGWSVAVGSGRADALGATQSEWIALAATQSRLAPLLTLENWRQPRPARQVWTDDYSSVLTVLR